MPPTDDLSVESWLSSVSRNGRRPPTDAHCGRCFDTGMVSIEADPDMPGCSVCEHITVERTADLEATADEEATP